MNIKTIATVDGVNAIDFGNTSDRYYWCKNIGDTCLHVSANQTCTADADGVAILPAGETAMIENYGSKIYVLGAGKIEIHEQETPDCPFKSAPVGGGGGETVTIIGDVQKFFREGITSIADLFEFWMSRSEVSDPRILIPKLISNTGVNGKASCNSDVNYNGANGNSSKAFYAFDGDDSTNLQYYSENQSGGWVQYEFNSPVSISKMSAKVGGYLATNSFDFRFQYYDDSTGTWVDYGDVQNITGTTAAKLEYRNFVVSDSTITTSKIRMISDTMKTSNTNWIVYEFQAYS